MTDSFDLQRFVDAQGRDVQARVLDELTAGRKRTHWMWFVLPQVAGLGRSETSMRRSDPAPCRAVTTAPAAIDPATHRASDDPVITG